MDDEKREIGLQATVPGVSIAQVTRRYAENANQIHNWLKGEQFAPAVQPHQYVPVFDRVSGTGGRMFRD